MKIELHASNDMDIETHFRKKVFNVNDVDDSLSIQTVSRKDITLSFYDYNETRWKELGDFHTIRIEER